MTENHCFPHGIDFVMRPSLPPSPPASLPPSLQGYPNELALCPDKFNCPRRMNAVIIMRFYTSDPDLPEANSKTDPLSANNPRLFGYEVGRGGEGIHHKGGEGSNPLLFFSLLFSKKRGGGACI